MMAALLCSVWLFHSFIVPVRDARHLIPAIPALLVLSASALAAFAGSITTITSASRRIVLAFGIIAAAAFFFSSVGDPARGMGAEAAVRQVLSQTVAVGCSAGLFGKLRGGRDHREGCRTGATARPSDPAGEPGPVELELGSIELPPPSRQRGRCRRVFEGRTHQCARPGSGISGFPCCGPASSAASRRRPPFQPVEASRASDGRFPLRHLPGHQTVTTESLTAFASCENTKSIAILRARTVTPPLNGNVSSPHVEGHRLHANRFSATCSAHMPKRCGASTVIDVLPPE